MLSSLLFVISAALPLLYAQQSPDETVLGVYIFHRHGDRTPKILAPTNLTDLGYRQTYQSGDYYRARYISSDAEGRITGVNSDEVLQSQIQVLAPDDDVLQQSAVAFMQALYPPVGDESESLADGTTVDAPLGGYQIVPVGQTETGAGSEDAGWLQSTSDCGNAIVSSNAYYTSPEYLDLWHSTMQFYQRLAPIIDPVFDESDRNFDNAYTIFDYINVAEIHNSTIPNSELLTDDILRQLRTLADSHEWNLAYNASTPIRAIAGSQLGGEIAQFLNGIIEDAGSLTGRKIGIQFGAYATFMSFFGLAGLADVNVDFTGVTDYASSMAFELFTNASTDVAAANFPREDEIFVRFLYHNGTASNASEPVAYPLFGSGQVALSWSAFMDGMNKIIIGDTEHWCTACGNSTGVCADYASTGSSGDSSSSSGSGPDASAGCSNGMSSAVNGIIGAMVTLTVVLGIEGLVLLLGGFRVVSKKTLARDASAAAISGETKA